MELLGSNPTRRTKVLSDKLLQYVHYKGLGMFPENNCKGETIIDVLDKDVEYKDRVAPAFRHVRDFVLNCSKANRTDLINEYFEAMKIYGINISIDFDVTSDITPNVDNVNLLVDELNKIQTEICQLNDYINDNAKATATEINMLNIANQSEETDIPVKIKKSRVKYALEKIVTNEKRRLKQYAEEKNEIFVHEELIDFIGEKDETDIKNITITETL